MNKPSSSYSMGLVAFKDLPPRIQKSVQDLFSRKIEATEPFSVLEVFDLWLQNEGIIGYTGAIVDALDSIRAAEAGQ